MNGCDGAKVGGWDKRQRNRQNAFAMLQRFGPAYSENCSIAGELDAVSGKIGFSLKKDKEATNNRHQRVACDVINKSNTVFMHRSQSTVIGYFWRDFVPRTRLRPFLVRAPGKLFKTSHAKL